MAKRKIAVLTGTRAEYGLLKPVMKAIQAHPALELQLIVTGMHLESQFGRSIQQIQADGFDIDREVPMHPAEDTGLGMAQAVASGIEGISEAFRQLEPDVLVILGDRTEILAASIAAMYMNIPIAHLHGGDKSQGGLDESVRHVVTKMAHIHFPATETSAQRIRNMGEKKDHIYVVGAPGLDTILHVPLPDRLELLNTFHLPSDQPYLLVVQHSVSTYPEKAVSQIRKTLTAITRTQLPTVWVYPNSDAGGRAIIQELETWVPQSPFIQAHRNLPHQTYLGLLKYAGALVGNSSSGMIESSSFQVPVVNIGIRQSGRERANNVIDVDHDALAIQAAIAQALSPEFRQQAAQSVNPYGKGTAGKQIAQYLAEIPLDKSLLQKQIAY